MIYRPFVTVDPDILSSYGEKPLCHLSNGQACDDTAAALLALCKELPWLRVTDLFRDVATQTALRKRYDHWVALGEPPQFIDHKVNPLYDAATMKDAYVATPGKSMHNAGRAVDLNTGTMLKNLGAQYLDAFWPIAAKYGFTPIIKRPDEGTTESWHFDHRSPAWKPVFDKYGADAGSLCCTLDVGQAGQYQSNAALVQALLLRAGFAIGAPDGILGKHSLAALAATGTVWTGSNDPAALEAAILHLRALPVGTAWVTV